MRTLFILLILVAGIAITGNAQKIEFSKVPAAVKETFVKHYPGVAAKWEKENGGYEASFTQNKKEVSVLFTINGTIVETETEIKEIDVPMIMLSYLDKNYKGKKIKGFAKITGADGIVTYEAAISGKDLIFDTAGSFLKEVKE
jgi:hypothetical protein